MSRPNRRSVVAGAVLAAGQLSGRAHGETALSYDYLFIDLAEGPAAGAQKRLRKQLADFGDLAAGGDLVGVFVPQLGWSTHQAAVLIRWTDETQRAAAFARLASLPGVLRVRRDRLQPTLRPSAADRPMPGGIYVHRWFTVDAPAVDEFVKLSGEGWRDFEARFDARIFGLFKAETAEAGAQRLLLITRYGSHGVWEASRDPTTEAMKTFARRQELTRVSSAASTLLVEP